MEVLMALQGTPMETDDPITSYMLQVFFKVTETRFNDTLNVLNI